MKRFEYGGYCQEKPVCGSIQAISAEQARQRLRDQDISVLRMREKKTRKPLFSKRFSYTQRALFTRQLATLLASSVPVAEALSCLAEQSEDPKAKQLALSLQHAVMSGDALSEACQQQEIFLGPLFASMVKAGEESSQLVQVLEALSDYTEQQASMRQGIQQALLYPLIMTSVALMVVFFLLWRVVPMMIQALQDTHQALPWPTAFLLEISQACQSFGWLILLMILAAVFCRPLYAKVIKKRVLSLFVRFPGIKSFVILINTTRFIRALSVLQAASVPLSTALTTASLLVQWHPLRKRIDTIEARIQAGVSLATALGEASYFSPMCVQMVRCGEKTGALSDALSQVAKWQSSQLSTRMTRYLTLFEPLLMLVMGCVVLFIVLSVMLPIFSMDQLSGMS